jgi:hypothetical protein
VRGTFHCPRLGDNFCTDGLLNISYNGCMRDTHLRGVEAILALLFSLLLIPNRCQFFVWSSVASQVDLRGLDSMRRKGHGLGSGGCHLVQVRRTALSSPNLDGLHSLLIRLSLSRIASFFPHVGHSSCKRSLTTSLTESENGSFA